MNWNAKRAAFYLIAFVIGVQLLLVVMSVLACIFAGLNGIDVGAKCSDGKFNEILIQALSTGLALYGGSKSDGDGKEDV